MAKAFLTRVAVEGFKAYRDRTELQLAPLTILIGANNSGKSSWIQELQLLSQTLKQPRQEVPLTSEGNFEFLVFRDLVHGRPAEAGSEGFALEIEWQAEVDLASGLAALPGRPDRAYLARHSKVGWLASVALDWIEVVCSLRIEYGELDRSIRINRIELNIRRKSEGPDDVPALKCWRQSGNGWATSWGEDRTHELELVLDRFLPILALDRSEVPSKSRERAVFNAWWLLMRQPTDDLKELLIRLGYLSSTRYPPPLLFRPAQVPPDEVGPIGQYAAQLLHSRQAETVRYARPLSLAATSADFRSRTLKDAVEEIYRDLGIDAPLRLEDLQEFGFRIYFGGYPVDQVGRGLWGLLPLIELGLISDPLRHGGSGQVDSMEDYLKALGSPTQIAIEEPECHLHPKVQSRLAQWYVALAMSGRRLMIETHSDHLVRKLRGMIARAEKSSPLERWLAENVIIAQVEQIDGVSKVVSSRLTKLGDIEVWPSDFMDEGSNEEREIYLAALDKDPPPALPVLGDLPAEDG